MAVISRNNGNNKFVSEKFSRLFSTLSLLKLHHHRNLCLNWNFPQTKTREKKVKTCDASDEFFPENKSFLTL